MGRETMTTATTTIINDASTADEVKAIHADLGSMRADDKKYTPRFDAWHPANLAHCIKQAKKGRWVKDDGSEIVTLGELATFCGEMKLANRLIIAQSGQHDLPMGARGAKSLLGAWAADNEIDWG
jgi:hypothetical protein